MPFLSHVITTCNILAYTRQYVSLSHIAKVLITKFDRGFSSTTMEEQSEWDYNVPVSIKQKKVLDIYCAFRAFEWRGWYTSRKHRERTAVKEIEGRTRHFPNTVRGITGRLCRGARLHIYRIIMYFEQLHFNILHIYAVKTPMSSIKLDFSIKTKI